MAIDSVYLVGCGGTGAILAPLLARLLQYHDAFADDGKITLVDADKYEEHNAKRQPVSGEHAGSFKCIHLLNLCVQQGLPAEMFVTRALYADEAWVSHNAKQSQDQLWIAAVDNDATRYAMVKGLAAAQGRLLFVTPGNAEATADNAPIRGQIMWYGFDDPKDLLIGMNPMHHSPNFDNPRDVIPRIGSCTENAPSNPQLISCNAMAAALTLSLINDYLDGLLSSRQHAIHFNSRVREFTYNLA